MTFASRVAVLAGGALIYHTHSADAIRMVREGLATRKSRVRVELVEQEPGKEVRGAHGNPQKYTFLEALGQPVNSHCHSLKLQIANPKNWPIFRAALVDCLPGDKQAEIRDLFAAGKRQAA